VKKVLMCSGKLYFELADKQQKENRKDIAIVRLEQVYPLPQKTIGCTTQEIQQSHLVLGTGRAVEYGSCFIFTDELKSINFGVISRNASALQQRAFRKCMCRNRMRSLKQHLIFN